MSYISPHKHPVVNGMIVCYNSWANMLVYGQIQLNHASTDNNPKKIFW